MMAAESPSNPAFTCHSRCILGITLDRDPNYFASYADDGTIAVWDRRVARMNTAAEPVLNFAPSMNDEFGRSSITSMRYSPVRTGMLAASTASGVVRVWETAKLSDQDSLHHSPSLSQLNSDAGVEVHKSRIGGWRDSAANLLEASRAYGGTSTSGTRTPNPRAYDSFETLLVHRAKDLVSPLRNTKGVVERRIVGFDWIVEGNSTSPARLIAITSEGAMDVLKCPGPVPSIAWGSRNQFATTCDRDLHYMPAPSTKAGIDHEKARSGGKSISDLDEYDDGGFWSESPDQRLGLLEKRRRERSNSVVKPEDFLPEPHEVLRNDISVTMRKRVEAGYRMSCAKNAKLTKREDRYLEDMWIWLDGAQECAKDQGMMSGMLDLSFLGVNPIWRGVRGE